MSAAPQQPGPTPSSGADLAVPRPSTVAVPRESTLAVPRPATVALAPTPQDRALLVATPSGCGCPPALVTVAGHLDGCPAG